MAKSKREKAIEYRTAVLKKKLKENDEKIMQLTIQLHALDEDYKNLLKSKTDNEELLNEQKKLIKAQAKDIMDQLDSLHSESRQALSLIIMYQETFL